jgi:hypothetical protein
MTAQELIQKLNKEYGIESRWPTFLEVDGETYANICQFIFDDKLKRVPYICKTVIIPIAIGETGGIFFKGMEIILKRKGDK